MSSAISMVIWCRPVGLGVYQKSSNILLSYISGLILGLSPANDRQRYFVTRSLIGCAQTYNQPCISLSTGPFFSQICFHITHWGRVTHICVSKLNIIGSENGLLPGWRQAIIWTNTGILLIWPSGTNFSEMLIEIHTFCIQENACENVVSEKVATLSRPQCDNHNVIIWLQGHKIYIDDMIHNTLWWWSQKKM